MVKNEPLFSDTIVAQATPPGIGGIGIIRISGHESLIIARKVLRKNIGTRVAVACDFFTEDLVSIDRGLAIFFAGPKSFTGEDVLELQGHGSPVVMDLLLQRVLELGARIAQPGEFTQRAFLNKKLDLAQAEAVADLINAQTQKMAQNAIRSLQGEFSKEIKQLGELITTVRIYIEAKIDFVDEVIGTYNFGAKIENILKKIEKIKKNAMQGIIYREGVTVVIAGNPNTGKSSLFNYFCGQNRAIVTSIPGTTRDLIHACINMDGLPVNLLDTAGLRQDNVDIVEKEGIRRALEEIKIADHVLFMCDAFLCKDRSPQIVWDSLNKVVSDYDRVTFLYNKIDLTGETAKLSRKSGFNCLDISVKNGSGLDLLKKHIKNKAGICEGVDQNYSARRRHLDILERAKKYILNIKKETEVELIADGLRKAQEILGEITGRVTSDDLLGKIFSEFCIGK